MLKQDFWGRREESLNLPVVTVGWFFVVGIDGPEATLIIILIL
jgi:hypothetical protein